VVLGTPAPRGAILLGRTLPYIGNGTFVAIVVTTVASLLLQVSLALAAIPGLLVAGLVAATSCAAFGLALGAIGMRVRDVWVISNTVWVSLWLLSGANVPREDLPTFLSVLGGVLPLSHAMEAARTAAAGGSFAAMRGSLLTELAVGASWALTATVLFRVFERAGRRHAALDVS